MEYILTGKICENSKMKIGILVSKRAKEDENIFRAS